MNDHQLLCFLTVSRTLNFSSAARELFITQPALSYQIRCLEKELGVELFWRSTTQVRLTEAGTAFLEPARQAYRHYLLAGDAIRPFVQQNQLVLQLPAVMTRRDPLYHVLMQRLSAAFPDCSIEVRTDQVSGRFHKLLSTGVDAAISIPFGPMEPEVERTPLFHTGCYVVAGPEHPLSGRQTARLEELSGQQLWYEPGEREYVRCLQALAELQGCVAQWTEVESYDVTYAALLAGRGLFLSPIQYEVVPRGWYLRVDTGRPLPDTCLLTLREDARPMIRTLRQLVCQVFREVLGAEQN